jgi:hypothetical protein
MRGQPDPSPHRNCAAAAVMTSSATSLEDRRIAAAVNARPGHPIPSEIVLKTHRPELNLAFELVMGAGKRTIANKHRAKLAAEPYDAGYLARKHSISLEQARELIRRIGNDRDKLNVAASRLFRK